MPRPAERTTKRRKIFRKTPGGDVKKITKRRISTKVKCAICKKTLHGATSSRKKSKTQKHPNRKFAGNLCHTCTTKVIKLQTRINDKTLAKKDISPKYKVYVK